MDSESTFGQKQWNLQYWSSKPFASNNFWQIFSGSRFSSTTLDFRIRAKKKLFSNTLIIILHAVRHGWIDFEYYFWNLCHQIYLNSFQNCKMVDPGLLGLLQLAKRFNNVHLADCQAGLRISRCIRCISGSFCSKEFYFFWIRILFYL